MKKNKVLLTKTGDTYNCRYVLDQTDIIDEKVDKGVSGKFPQIIPYRLEEKDNQREFIYEIGNKVQLTEFLKKEINKKQMLTLLYNLLSGLEAFGMNMISLSYVAKDIQYVFVAPESLNVYFIVAGVDKEITDLNEVRNFVKDVICNAHYFEMDRDNYVARLITFTNKLGTFSVGDMKEFVNQLLIDMGIHIEEEKKKTEKKEEKTANDKVSRIGVMQNNAKMVQPGASVGGSVPPMPKRQVPPMPNGQPMPGRPMPMQMGPDGKPIVPPIPNRPSPSMPEKKPEAAPVPPMPEKKPEAAPVPPMPEKKPEAAPVPPVEEKKPQVPVPYLLRIATNEKIYINKPEFSIGRSATKADYTVTDNSDVSRIHCIIERKNGVSYIRDNASTNGTFVNGQNIAGQKNVFLTNNAKVSLGDEGFIYFVR